MEINPNTYLQSKISFASSPFCIDPGTQEPGAIDVCNVTKLQCGCHVSGWVRIDVIVETIPQSGRIDGLLEEIDSVGILGIKTVCAYQLGLVRKG